MERELLGTANLGGGALKFSIRDIENFLIPRKLKTLGDYKPDSFFVREIKPLFEEIGIDEKKPVREQEPKPLPDRKRLDDIVFDAIGLTQPERKEVYWSVCELVKTRLDKAGSV